MSSPMNSSSSDTPPSPYSETPIVKPAQQQWIQQSIALVSTAGSKPRTRILYERFTPDNVQYLSGTVQYCLYPTVCPAFSYNVKCTHHADNIVLYDFFHRTRISQKSRKYNRE